MSHSVAVATAISLFLSQVSFADTIDDVARKMTGIDIEDGSNAFVMRKRKAFVSGSVTGSAIRCGFRHVGNEGYTALLRGTENEEELKEIAALRRAGLSLGFDMSKRIMNDTVCLNAGRNAERMNDDMLRLFSND